jgi:CHAT domain-containing protein
VSSGDGVYSMRRALVLAGVESQVVSLWSALRQAKLHLLHQSRYAHPYYWAAFIPADDWRPLAKNTIRLQRPAP